MAQQQRKSSFVGKGTVYLALVGVGILADVGNCSKLDFTINETTKDLPDYQSAGGGSAAYYTRVDHVEVAMDLRVVNPDNLALAYHGSVTPVAAATAQTKTLTPSGYGLIPLLDMAGGNVSLKDTTPAAWVASATYAVGARVKSGTGANTHSHVCTVAGVAGGTAPAFKTDGTTVVDGGVTWQDEGLLKTYTSGTDYVVKPGGLLIPPTSTITINRSVDLTYDRSQHYLIDVLTQSAQNWYLHVEGLNEADSGAPHVIDVPIVKFGSAKSLPLLGDDFATLSMTGRIQKSAQNAPGTSAFFQMRQLAAA